MIDYKKASESLGVDIASVKALAEVESNGSGLITDPVTKKVVPKILFERHIMFKRLRDYTAVKSEEMFSLYPDIVNPSSGGYLGGIAEYGRLEKAIKIDHNTALESASWGAYQVMGYYWKTLGYKSVQEFVDSAYTEEGQLEIFIRFVKASPNVLKALKSKDWEALALAYNGASYLKNSYNTKLKESYAKFSK